MTPDSTLVLDNEAVQALADVGHRKHRAVQAFVVARATRSRRRSSRPALLVPTVVRVEALLDRRAPSTSSLWRMQVRDVALDTSAADQAVALRSAAGGSATDACVAAAAAAAPGPVTVLTSDLTDLPALLRAAESRAIVHRV